jgi:hypothetical protein
MFDKKVNSEDLKTTILDSKTISNISNFRNLEGQGQKNIQLGDSSNKQHEIISSQQSAPQEIKTREE